MESIDENEKKPVRHTIQAAGSGPSRKAHSVAKSLGIASARTDRGNRNQAREHAQWVQESQLDGFEHWVPAQSSEPSGSGRSLKTSDFPRASTTAPPWVQKKPQKTDSRDGPPEEDDDVAGMPDWKPLPVKLEPGVATAVAKKWQRAAKLALRDQHQRDEKKRMEDMLNSVKTIMFFNNAAVLQQKMEAIYNKYDRHNRSKLLDGKIRPDFVGDIEHIADYWTEEIYDNMQNTLMHGQQQLHQRNVDLADMDKRVQDRAADRQLKQDREKLNEQIKLYHSTMELGKATLEQNVVVAKKNLELLRQEIEDCKEQHETNVREHEEYEEEWFDLARRQKQMMLHIEEYEEKKKEANIRLRQELDKLRQELAIVKRTFATLDRVYKDDCSRIKEMESKIIARISNKLLMNREPFLDAHLERMLRKKRYFEKAYMLKKASAEKHIEDLKKTLDEKRGLLREATSKQNISDLWKLALQAKLVCVEFRLRNHELTKDGEISEADFIEKKVWKLKRDPPFGLLPMLARELDHQRSWLMARGMRFELDAKSLRCTSAMGVATPMSLITKIAGTAMRDRENMLQAVQLMKTKIKFSELAQSKAANTLMSRVGQRRAELGKAAAAQAAAAAQDMERQESIKEEDMEMTVKIIRGEISETVSRVLYREYDEQLHGSDSESDAPSEPGEDGEGKRPLPEELPVMHVILQMENLGRLEKLINRLASDWSLWQEKHSNDDSMEELGDKFAAKIADLKEGLKLATASTHWLSGASLQAAALCTDIVWRDLKWLASLVGQLKARCGALRAVASFLKQMESDPENFELARDKTSYFLDGLEQLADEEAVDAAEIWMLRLQQGLRKRLDLVKETLSIYSHYLSQKSTAAAGKKSGPGLRSVVAGSNTMVAVLTSKEVKSAKAHDRLTVAELVGLLHLSAIRLLKDALPDAFNAVCMGMEAMNQDAMQHMLKEFQSGPENAPEEFLELEKEEEEQAALLPGGTEECDADASKEERSAASSPLQPLISETVAHLSEVANRSVAFSPEQISDQESRLSMLSRASDESSSRLLAGDKRQLSGSPEELAKGAASASPVESGSHPLLGIDGRPTSDSRLSTPGFENSRPNSQLGATFTDSFVGEDGFLTPSQDRANAKTPQSGDSSQHETEAPDSNSNSPDTQKRQRRMRLATMLAFKKIDETSNMDEPQVVSPPGQASIPENQNVQSRGKRHALADSWHLFKESLEGIEEDICSLTTRTDLLLSKCATEDERASVQKSHDMQMELMHKRKQEMIDDARATMQQQEENQLQLQVETAHKEACPNEENGMQLQEETARKEARLTLKILGGSASVISKMGASFNQDKQLAVEQEQLAAEEEQQAQVETELQRQLDEAQNEDQNVQIAQKMASLRTLRERTTKKQEEIALALEQVRLEQLRQQEAEAQEVDEEEEAQEVGEIAVAAYVLRVSERGVAAAALRQAKLQALGSVSLLIPHGKGGATAESRRLPADRGDDDEDSETDLATRKMSRVIIEDQPSEIPSEIETAPAPSQKTAAKRFSSFARGSRLVRGSVAIAKNKRPSLTSSDSSDDSFGDDFIVAAPKPPTARRKSVFHNLQKPEKRVLPTQAQQSSLALGPELGLAVHQTGMQQRDYHRAKQESPLDQERPRSQEATAPSPGLPQHSRRSSVNSSHGMPIASVDARRGSSVGLDKQWSSRTSRVEGGAIEDAVVSKKMVDPMKTKKQHQELLDANDWVNSFISGTGDNILHEGISTKEVRERQEEGLRRFSPDDQPRVSSRQELLMGMGRTVAAPSALQRMSMALDLDQQKVLDDMLSFPGQCMIPEQHETPERENLDVSLHFQVGVAPVSVDRKLNVNVQVGRKSLAAETIVGRKSLAAETIVGRKSLAAENIVGRKSLAAEQSRKSLTATRMRYLPGTNDEKLESTMAATGGGASGDEIGKTLKGKKALCAKRATIQKDNWQIVRKSVLTKHPKVPGKSSAPDMPSHLEVWEEGDPMQVWDEANLALHSWMQEEGCTKVSEIGVRRELVKVASPGPAHPIDSSEFKDALGTPQDSLMEGHRTTVELSTDRVLVSQEDSLFHGGDSLMTLSSGPSFFGNLRPGTLTEGGEREERLPGGPLPRLVEVRQSGVGDPTAASLVDKNVSWSAAAVQGARVALRSEKQGRHAPAEQHSKAGTRALTTQPLTPAPELRLPLPLRGMVSNSEAAVVSKRGSVLGSPGGWANSLGKDLGHTSPIPPGIVLKTWPRSGKFSRPATSDGQPSPRRHMMGAGLVNRVV